MLLSDIFAAIRWWAVLMVLGTAVTPLAYTLLGRLPDRGYAFVKMLGLLLVSYLFWLLGSLGFLGNNVGGILFALAAVIALSVWVYWRLGQATDDRRLSLVEWLRENKRQVLITELVFALVFAFWVWVRAQNPAITATEKPMEFAFLNAVGRSPSFPPLDPWLSGYAISYYYFGYVMTSVIARLAAVPEPAAFNLGIAWLIAGTATGAFGLVYNLVAGGSRRRTALLLGLLAALALPIAGNQQIVLEVMHANNVGSAEFWQWLDVRDINTAPDPAGVPRYETTNWWWWRASRVIHEHHLSGRAEEGLEPIAEFPAFSFILGDMHPHVLALPFAFLSLAIAYLWYLGIGDWRLETGDYQSQIPNLQSLLSNPLCLLTALILGGLSFLNTWDVLIHLFVVLGAFLLGRWRRYGWESRLLAQTLTVGVLLILPAVLLYLPFYIGFRSQAGPPFLLPMLMRPTRLPHFLIIFGMPLWSITILLIGLAQRQRFRHWRAGITAAVAVIVGPLLLMLLLGWIVASSAGAGPVANLANELGVTLSPRPDGPFAPGWGATAVLALLPAIIQSRLQYPGVTLLLATLLALVIMAWIHLFNQTNRDNGSPSNLRLPTLSPAHPLTRSPFHPLTRSPAHPTPLPFILLLIFTGTLLTLGPEFVYLRDNFGVRLNTVFKFYYQAWVMFGVAALFGLDYLWREFGGGARRLAPIIATGGYTLALLLALLFPYYAIQSRAAEYRGAVTAETRQPPTLNGLAQLKRHSPDEYEAIMWLRQNVPGAPVVVEAVGGQYSGYARVSASTGLPTLLGWAGHEYQWRGSSTQEPGLRDPVVHDIYSLPGWEETVNLLNRYNVEYIYIGGLELSTYGPRSREKFSDRLPVAYQNDTVTIYRWQPQQLN